VQGSVDEQRRVRNVGADPLRVRLELSGDLFEVERWNAVDALQPDVLLGERDHDLLPQELRLEEILDANSQYRGLVRVAGPDAALRGTDL
jgi:hypothetical protein